MKDRVIKVRKKKVCVSTQLSYALTVKSGNYNMCVYVYKYTAVKSHCHLYSR